MKLELYSVCVVSRSRQFASLEETQKEEMKKERRRLQEQLRRIKRNQERDVTSPKLTKKQRKELFKNVSAGWSFLRAVTTYMYKRVMYIYEIMRAICCAQRCQIVSHVLCVVGIQSLCKYDSVSRIRLGRDHVLVV